MSIFLKRAYEPPHRADGYRILVDRLWPHGVSKDKLQLDMWVKTVAPSTGLRKWFGHDPKKWDAFRARYFRELDGAADAIEPIVTLLSRASVTLVYAAKDPAFNNAVALKEYIERHRARGANRGGHKAGRHARTTAAHAH